MELAARIDGAKYAAFRWRYELSVPKKLVLSLAMVALTTLLAQIKFYLPGSLVPITGQTLGTLFSGVFLGAWWGGISMLLYALLGAIGLPLFAGWTHGFSVLGGPTGGYIVGFIFASLLIGFFTDRYVRSRSFFVMLGLMLVANFVLIYIPGLLQLNNFLSAIGKPVNMAQLLTMGLIPFIPGDIFKAVIAAVGARIITPKKAFGKEVDKDKWANWRHPLKIRGHHLLCLLGFRGHGYSPAFVEAMRQVRELFRSQPDTPIVLVTGCDVICASCPHKIEEECRKSPDAAKRIKTKDAAILKKLGFRANSRTTPGEAWDRIKIFKPGDVTTLCGRCQWLELGYCVEGLKTLKGKG